MLLRKGLASSLGNAGQRAAVLVLYLYSSREMEPNSFGVVTSLIALAVTIGSLASLSLGHTANRTLSRIKVLRLKSRISLLIAQLAFLASSVAALFFLAFANILSELVADASLSSEEKFSLAIAIFSISLSSCYKGHIWAEMRYELLLFSSLASSVALCVAYLTLSRLSVPTAMLHSYTVMVAVEAMMLFYVVIKPLSTQIGLFCRPRLRELYPVLRFSGVSSLNGLLFTPVNLIVVALVTASLGSSAAGQFNLLVQLRNVIVFLPNSFSSVLLTLMARARSSVNLWHNSLLMASLASLVAAPVCIVAYVFSPADADEEYLSLLLITACTGVIIAFNGTIGQAFLALGRLWFGVFANAIWASATIIFVGVALLNSHRSLQDVLYAIVGGYVMHTVLQTIVIRKVGGKSA